jgi:hypothetical protein
MAYLGTQSNDVVKNIGIYSPSQILQLTKDGSWGGSLELLTSSTVSTMSSAIDFTNVFDDGYDVYFLKTKNVRSDTSGYTVGIQFYESGVLESAGVYQYGHQSGRANGTFGEGRSTTESWMHIGADTDNTTENSSNSYCYIFNPTNSSKFTYITMHATGEFGTTGSMRFGGGVLPQASTVDGFRLRSTYTTGQISGEFLLFGVKDL